MLWDDEAVVGGSGILSRQGVWWGRGEGSQAGRLAEAINVLASYFKQRPIASQRAVLLLMIWNKGLESKTSKPVGLMQPWP